MRLKYKVIREDKTWFNYLELILNQHFMELSVFVKALFSIPKKTTILDYIPYII